MRRIFLSIGVVLVLVAGVAGWNKVVAYRERQRIIAEQQAVQVPDPEPVSSSKPTQAVSSAATKPVASSAATALKAAVNWAVPFTSQAPTGDWDELHGEACEEASVLMVMRFFAGEPMGSASEADEAIKSLVATNTSLGFPIDDTAAEVIVLLKEVAPDLNATLLKNPTTDDLKKVLAEGKLVIVPAAGRMLGNPYYTAPGPIYHMLVLRGYTDSGYVITNDPGTKRGEKYVYKWDTMLSAIHDWNGGDVENGEKVVVVVGK